MTLANWDGDLNMNIKPLIQTEAAIAEVRVRVILCADREAARSRGRNSTASLPWSSGKEGENPNQISGKKNPQREGAAGREREQNKDSAGKPGRQL